MKLAVEPDDFKKALRNGRLSTSVSELRRTIDMVVQQSAARLKLINDKLAIIDRQREALHEAERFMSYFSNETGGHFVGPGTPMSCLAEIRRALSPDPRGPFFSTQWESEDYERRQRGEPELGPDGVSTPSRADPFKGVVLCCPFCSGKAELIEADTGTKDVWLARCTWCQVKTVNYYDPVTPRLVWNRREGNYLLETLHVDKQHGETP
jgi:hypothetical protein